MGIIFGLFQQVHVVGCVQLGIWQVVGRGGILIATIDGRIVETILRWQASRVMMVQHFTGVVLLHHAAAQLAVLITERIHGLFHL